MADGGTFLRVGKACRVVDAQLLKRRVQIDFALPDCNTVQRAGQTFSDRMQLKLPADVSPRGQHLPAVDHEEASGPQAVCHVVDFL
jgi:hypothetical protein